VSETKSQSALALVLFACLLTVVSCDEDAATQVGPLSSSDADVSDGLDAVGDAPDVDVVLADSETSTDLDGLDARDGADITDADAVPDLPAPGEELPIEPSADYLARQAEYFDFCVNNNGPGSGSVYGQGCRVAAGEATFHDDAIDRAIERLEERRDAADFQAAGLVRLLYLDDETGALGDERRSRIEQTLLDFKYWLDEPGDDGMAYWTENHQILFHSAELLMGQRFPDTIFSNSGMTGREHMEHALPRLRRWLELRGRYGFSEWHSNVYYNEDMPALVNLADFAEDDGIRDMAWMVLDVVALDLLHNTFRGALATTHGRTYQSKFIGGSNDSTAEAAWIMLGLGQYESASNFTGSFLATSSYYPPPLLESLASATAPRLESRQRDSFDISEGAAIGVSYEGVDDVVVWAGMAGIVAPDVIDGAMDVMEEYDLWDGFLFGALPEDVLDLLRGMMGTPQLRAFSVDMLPLSQGMALEAVDTYVYRQPEYQLAGAQDYKPGMWAAQTLMWRASLGPDAFVMTTSPALVGVSDIDDVTIDDPWIGGWMPRVTMHEQVGVIQYRAIETSPAVDLFVTSGDLRAYFPEGAFDEVVIGGRWHFGRLGDGYLGLWSQNEMVIPEGRPDDNDYEWHVAGRDNTFVVQLGSAGEFGDFESFIAALTVASPSVGEDQLVRFASPTTGDVEVGWEGAMTVDGVAVDLGPYPRWDTPHALQERGSAVLDVSHGGQLLRYNFDRGVRRLYRVE